MSGPKPPNLCPTCRHLSSNGKICYVTDMHPFKKGVCRAYEARAGQRNEPAARGVTSGQEEAET